MGLKSRIRKLEKVHDQRYDVFVLPDGTIVRYKAHDDTLEALNCAVEGRPHFLVEAALKMDTREGFPGLLRALGTSVAASEDEDDEP